ncbi:pre-mRNA-splicing factor 18-like [Ptychodera flava]|uniref:pre-mRNA-splicing factor 18-like n=1 Tax=Ptychodera flava TaxID=63121 RepID=UPI00396A9EE2
MDFLKAEIARKKKQLEKSEVTKDGKKYFKRGELIAKQEEAYWKKHYKGKIESPEKETESNEKPDYAGSSSEDSNLTLSREEVVRRLRERGQPIRLFGESDLEAFQRLRILEIQEPEINPGMRNDFKAAMDQVDQDFLSEVLKTHGGEEDSKKGDVKVVDDGRSLEDIQKMATDFGNGDDDLDSEVILVYLKFLLQVWGKTLNSRPVEVKRSVKGKLEAATHSQTVSYLKPLLRKLKRRRVSPEILEFLVHIVRNLLDGDYVKANDYYLQMAIGNAPWPIGVTMVGIHARTGREKIFSQQIAHVLNDETQRKYIQGLKRLMTLCQKQFPTDPSRSVEYNAL